MTILNQITVGDILHLVVDSNPALNGGIKAPIGSLATDSTNGTMYAKTTALDTGWQSISGEGFNPTEKLVNIVSYSIDPGNAANNSSYKAVGYIYITKSEYIIANATLSIQVKYIGYNEDNNTSGNVRLVNVQTGIVLPNSTVTIPTNTTTATVLTGNINPSDIPAGETVYEVQLNRSTGGKKTYVVKAGFKVINTFN